MPRKPAPPVDTRPPVAYSYLRFSTPDQAKGDSLRRQTGNSREKWLAANPDVPLDTSLRMTDPGRSAFRRKNWDAYALAEFVKRVESGEVAPGSYLLVENLDRLSRENVGDAVELFLRIVNRGAVVVQLEPVVTEFRRPVGMIALMMAVVELARGNSESEMKSVRSAANWEKALRLAREGKPMTPRRKDGRVTKSITGRLPAWVEEKSGREEKGDRLVLIPRRAKVVKRIFEMSAAGLGMTRIVKKLKDEKVPAFGGREKGEDGRTRKRDGDVYGCGEWRTAYVRSILSDRRALGEYQPRDANDQPKGDLIPDYYPAVVTDKEYWAARAGAASRRKKAGRIGDKVANLFGGLMVNARDGSTYYAAPRSEKNRPLYRVLLNKSSVEGDSRAYTFRYSVFEAAVLAGLREIDSDDVLPPAEPGKGDELRDELDAVREKIAALRDELRKGDSPTLFGLVRESEAREAELVALLDDAKEVEAAPLDRSLEEAKTLAGMLAKATATELEDVRLRLRDAIRRVVDSVYVLVVPRGARDRLALVSLNFRGGGRRNYLIVNRSPAGNQNKSDPGGWAVRTWMEGRAEVGGPYVAEALDGGDLTPPKGAKNPDPPVFDPDDLRSADAVAIAIETLETFPAETIERLLADPLPW